VAVKNLVTSNRNSGRALRSLLVRELTAKIILPELRQALQIGRFIFKYLASPMYGFKECCRTLARCARNEIRYPCEDHRSYEVLRHMTKCRILLLVQLKDKPYCRSSWQWHRTGREDQEETVPDEQAWRTYGDDAGDLANCPGCITGIIPQPSRKIHRIWLGSEFAPEPFCGGNVMGHAVKASGSGVNVPFAPLPSRQCRMANTAGRNQLRERREGRSRRNRSPIRCPREDGSRQPEDAPAIADSST
jgi:hypothetical protein